MNKVQKEIRTYIAKAFANEGEFIEHFNLSKGDKGNTLEQLYMASERTLYEVEHKQGSCISTTSTIPTSEFIDWCDKH